MKSTAGARTPEGMRDKTQTLEAAARLTRMSNLCLQFLIGDGGGEWQQWWWRCWGWKGKGVSQKWLHKEIKTNELHLGGVHQDFLVIVVVASNFLVESWLREVILVSASHSLVTSYIV